MKYNKKIKIFAIIISIVIIIISFFLIPARVRLNALFFLGRSDSIMCGGKGYIGNSIDGGLECCGAVECCGIDGFCMKNGCYVCK